MPDNNVHFTGYWVFMAFQSDLPTNWSTDPTELTTVPQTTTPQPTSPTTTDPTEPTTIPSTMVPPTIPPQTSSPTSTLPPLSLPSLPLQEMIKNPDRTVVRVGEPISWTLRGFNNPTGQAAVTNFAVIDVPSRGLNFSHGSTPAFTNGQGIVFDIRYRVYGSAEWRTHAAGLSATQPHEFSLPQPGDLYYTHIGLFFGDVPVGFALGDEIVLTFIVGADAPDNELVNRFFIMYSNNQREGASPYRPTVIPHNVRVNPRTGDIAAAVTPILGGIAATICVLLLAGKVLRKKK